MIVRPEPNYRFRTAAGILLEAAIDIDEDTREVGSWRFIRTSEARQASHTGMPNELPEASRIQDSQCADFAQNEQVLVSRHKDVGSAGKRSAEDDQVVGISNDDRRRLRSALDGRSRGAENRDDFANHLIGHADLLGQGTGDLVDQGYRDEQLVLRQDETEHVRAQTARRERGDEHVRVEEDPHDTILNTSSSVSSPCASANGATRRRI